MVTHTLREKCPRCWRYRPFVHVDDPEGELCDRCAEVVGDGKMTAVIEFASRGKTSFFNSDGSPKMTPIVTMSLRLPDEAHESTCSLVNLGSFTMLSHLVVLRGRVKKGVVRSAL